jgi:hypothetical protein
MRRIVSSSCHWASSLTVAARRFGNANKQVRAASSDSKTLKKTLVYDENVKIGGVMVHTLLVYALSDFGLAFQVRLNRFNLWFIWLAL